MSTPENKTTSVKEINSVKETTKVGEKRTREKKKTIDEKEKKPKLVPIQTSLTIAITFPRTARHVRRCILHNQRKLARLLNKTDAFGQTKWRPKKQYIQVFQTVLNAMLHKLMKRCSKLAHHRQMGRYKNKQKDEKPRLQLMQEDWELAWCMIRQDAHGRLE